MSQRWAFAEKEPFLEKLRELRAAGVEPGRIDTRTPHPLHELEELLPEPPSPLRRFTLLGSLGGLAVGIAFPILTVLHWPLITGGKPLISLPAFVIVAFELTILLGAGASFTGFLLLSGLPDVARVLEPEETGNDFVVILEDEP